MANRWYRIITLLMVSATASSLFTGCVTTLPWLAKKETVPIVPVAHAAMAWENEVLFTSDPVNGGRPTPCLAGRMYLLGGDIKNGVKANGSVTVKLFVEQPGNGDMPPPVKLLERWNIDSSNIHRLGKKDLMWGYTLVLPWATYDPRIGRVQLSVCYTPEGGGAPIYAHTRLRLRHQKRRFKVTNHAQSTQPPNGQSPAPGQNVLPQPRQLAPQGGNANPNPSRRRVITRSNQMPIR